MKSDDLRSIQAPLKECYRDTPAAALITLRAHGRIGAGFSCKIDTGQALRIAGLHPNPGASPGAGRRPQARGSLSLRARHDPTPTSAARMSAPAMV